MALKIVTSMSSSFEAIPEGVYDTNVIKIYEKQQMNNFKNIMEDGIQFLFEIVDGELKGKKIGCFMYPAITPRAKLFALSKAVLGREFTPEELAGINDLEDIKRWLGGKPVTVVVKDRVSAKGKKYYNVADFLKSVRFGKVNPVPLDESPVKQWDGGHQVAQPQQAVPHPAETQVSQPDPVDDFPPAGEEEEIDVDEIASALEDDSPKAAKAKPSRA